MQLPNDGNGVRYREYAYKYDSAGNTTDVVDPRGVGDQSGGQTKPYTTHLEYDAFDRLVKQWRPQLGSQKLLRQWTYDRNNNLTSYTDGSGAVTTRTYTLNDQLATTVLPANGTAQTPTIGFAYDDADRLVAAVRPRGYGSFSSGSARTQAFLACESGTLTALGAQTTSYCLDDAGRRTAQVESATGHSAANDPIGPTRITAFAYDRRDDLVGVLDPARARGLTPAAAAARAASNANARSVMTYDKAGERLSAEDHSTDSAASAKYRYEYDANGNRTIVHGPKSDGQTTTTGYDQRDQPVTITDALGRMTCIARRADELPVRVTTPRGTAGSTASQCADPQHQYTYFTTAYTYNGAGDVTSRSIPYSPGQYGREAAVANWKVSYARNAVGDPLTITDARGNQVQNTFYDTGDLKSTTRPSWWALDWGQQQGEPSAGDRFSTQDDVDTTVPADGPQLSESGGAANSGVLPSLPKGLGQTDLGEVKPQQPTAWLPAAGMTQFSYDGEMRLTDITPQQTAAETAANAPAANITRSIKYWPSGLIQDKLTPYKGSDRIDHSFTWDVDGNLASSSVNEANYQGASCCTTNFTYDGYDKLTSRDAPGASNDAASQAATREVSTFDYDPNGNVITRTTPRSTVFRYAYDSLDQLLTEADPTGAKWTYGYDAAGSRTSEISPLGTAAADQATRDLYTTTLAYDDAEQLAGITQKVMDQGTQQTLQTTFGYDDDGNRSSVTAPGTASGGDATGSVGTLKTTTTYDGRGLPWQTTTGAGTGAANTTVTEYDANGNLRRTVNGLGVDQATKLPGATDGTDLDAASKDATVRTYDASDQLTQVRLPWNDADVRKFTQRFDRDDRGRIASIFSPYETDDTKAPRTNYTYFDSDWPKSVTDTKVTKLTADNPSIDRQVSYDYDHRGDQTSWETDNGVDTPNGRVMTRSYYPNGLLAGRVARKNTDPADNSAISTRVYAYAYNPNRSLTVFKDVKSGRLQRIDRDPAERELRVLDKLGADTQYDYDLDGNLTSRKTDGNLTPPASPQDGSNAGWTFTGADAKTTTFDYDSLDRETKMTVRPGTGSDRIFTTRWWPSSQTRQQTRPGGGTTTWTYNGRGLVDSRNRTGPGTALSTTFGYDDNNNRLTDERGSYAYNARNQVTSWKRNNQGPKANWTTTYLLRGDGAEWNRQERDASGTLQASTDYCYVRDCDPTVSRGTGERLWQTIDKQYVAGSVSVTQKSYYAYDDLGSVTRINRDVTGASLPPNGPSPNDAPAICDQASGQPAAGETLYCYDEFERLKFSQGAGVKDPSDITYDGLDRRDTRKTYDTTGTPQPPSDYSYVGSSERVARETRPDGSRRLYDYDSQGRPVGRDSTASGQSYRSYAKDANGSIIGLEKSDGTNPTDEVYSYDPYGELDIASGPDPKADPETSLSPDAKDNALRFEGFYYDSGVKTYDMNAREYRPEGGRFLSADLFASAAGDQVLQSDPLTQNRYVFTGGNPVNNVEFDGHIGPHGDQGESKKVRQKLLEDQRTNPQSFPAASDSGSGGASSGSTASSPPRIAAPAADAVAAGEARAQLFSQAMAMVAWWCQNDECSAQEKNRDIRALYFDYLHGDYSMQDVPLASGHDTTVSTGLSVFTIGATIVDGVGIVKACLEKCSTVARGIMTLGGRRATASAAKAGTDIVRYNADEVLGRIAGGSRAKASELADFAEGQGWARSQTATGPLKYTDENGVTRLTIKSGSSRTPGSNFPHVEIRNAAGQRVDPYGNAVARRSPGNHTPIDWDIP